MDKLEKAKRLKGMLSQIAGRQGLKTIASASARASGGLESISPERTNVQSGLEKLADNRNQDITPNEMFGLEAIVMKENRPAIFVRGNSYDDVGDPWSSLNVPEVKRRLSALFPLIGRIELPNSPFFPTREPASSSARASSRPTAMSRKSSSGSRPNHPIPRRRRRNRLQGTGGYPRGRPLRLLRRARRRDNSSVLGHGPVAGGRIAHRQHASLVGALAGGASQS